STSYLSCEGRVVGRNVTTRGYYFDTKDLDDIVKALGLPRVPANGLLLGRVIDETTGEPLSNVSVRPPPGINVTIKYPAYDEVADTWTVPTSTGATSRTGLFLVDNYQSYTTCCGKYSVETPQAVGESTAPVGFVK